MMPVKWRQRIDLVLLGVAIVCLGISLILKYRKALKFCEQCWAAPICQGPCPADIMKRDGDFYDHEIEFCKNEKINMECRAYIWSWKYDNNLASR